MLPVPCAPSPHAPALHFTPRVFTRGSGVYYARRCLRCEPCAAYVAYMRLMRAPCLWLIARSHMPFYAASRHDAMPPCYSATAALCRCYSVASPAPRHRLLLSMPARCYAVMPIQKVVCRRCRFCFQIYAAMPLRCHYFCRHVAAA